MWNKACLTLALTASVALLAGCDGVWVDDTRDVDATGFPEAHRPVSQTRSNQYGTEAKRDEAGEAQTIMDRASVKIGMSVADIGAGNGYYTVRLSERVGPKGRVLAQDIDPNAISILAQRVERERLDNVSVVTGKPADPGLPKNSFDRVFLVHMYHEVTEPYPFLWRLWPTLKEGGQIIVVDRDRPTDDHGIPPRLLFCEIEAVGFELIDFSEKPEIGGFIARFKRGTSRPEPDAIAGCVLSHKKPTEKSK
jgi:ubiquinone/menaquinone biosynthesis C-methylase UbiE